MADSMDDIIHQIETAVRGEEVRTSIINAINKISNNRDAGTLNGHSSSWFAKAEDMETLTPVSTKVTANNSKPVSSGAVYTYIANISTWLENVLGETSSNTAVADKLISLYRNKQALIAACNYAGASFSTDAAKVTLTAIADWITSYSRPDSMIDPDTGEPISLNFTTLNVTENDTYTAESTDSAWNKVVVNVKPKLTKLNANNVDYKTLKQTYSPKSEDDEEHEGYSEVTVDISRHIKSELKINKISANGKATFKASDENDEAEDSEDSYIYGYKTVSVDVSSQLKTLKVDSSDDLPDDPRKINFSVSDENNSDDDDDSEDKVIGYKSVKIDISSKLDEKVIEVDASNFGEEQTFMASEEENPLYGYSKIIVRVVESEGPFTVTFYNNRTKLDTAEDVPKNGSARYKGPSTSEIAPEGKIFDGWNPEPINVTKNMDCYAQFIDEKDNPVSVNESTNEISGSWDDIVKDGGASLPIGAWKILNIRETQYGGETVPAFQAVVQKVAAGEQGTNATWLSRTPIPKALKLYTGGWHEEFDLGENQYLYEHSDLRAYLNGALYSAMMSSDKKFGNSQAFINAIQPVYKNVYDVCPNKAGYDARPISTEIYLQEPDKIWLPSKQELGATGRGVERGTTTYVITAIDTNELPPGTNALDTFATRSYGSYSKTTAGPIITSNGTSIQKMYMSTVAGSLTEQNQNVFDVGYKEGDTLGEMFYMGTCTINSGRVTVNNSISTAYSYRDENLPSSITYPSQAAGVLYLCFGFCT